MKVSICIPTLCNTSTRLEMLKECIDSCLNQTYHNIEVIVVDNASKIDITTALNEIRDSRLKVIRNKATIPMPANFNKALQSATGEILKPMCDDDIIHPDFISMTIDDAKTKFVYVSSSKFHSKNEVDFIKVLRDNDTHIIKFFKGFSIDKLTGRGIFPTATIFSANIYKFLNGYTEETVHFDFDFWVMASLFFDSIFYNIPLAFFRGWEESYTQKNQSNPMSSYVASSLLTRKLLHSDLLIYKNKLLLKFRLIKNMILSTFVLIKRLILTPSKNLIFDYFNFLNKSIKVLFIF